MSARWLLLLLAVIGLTLPPSPAVADHHDPVDEEGGDPADAEAEPPPADTPEDEPGSSAPCTDVFVDTNPENMGDLTPSTEADACRSLAGRLTIAQIDRRLSDPTGEATPEEVASRTARAAEAFGGLEAAALAPRETPSLGQAGTGVQVASASTAAPVPGAGGSFGLTGGEGPKGTASVSVNLPALLSVDNPEAFARMSRFTDLSVVFPTDLKEMLDPTYLGARLRLDVMGLVHGGKLTESSLEVIKDYLRSYGAYAGLIEDLFLDLSDGGAPTDEVSACFVALDGATNLAELAAASKETCGRDLSVAAAKAGLGDPAADLDNALVALRDALDELREETDRGSLGIEVLGDFPLKDETGIPGRFAAVIAGGFRGQVKDGAWDLGFSGRIGLDVVRTGTGNDDYEEAAGLLGSVGFVAHVHFDEVRRLRFSIAATGRYGEVSDGYPDLGIVFPQDGNHLGMSLSLDLPLFDGLALAGSLYVPFLPSGEPQLTISTDFSQLLTALAPNKKRDTGR